MLSNYINNDILLSIIIMNSIYLYHIPQVSGVGLSINLVKKLKEAYPEFIIGIKDSSGVWENTEALLNIKDLVVYPGAELPVIEAIKLGAPGCISATANLNSKDLIDQASLKAMNVPKGKNDLQSANNKKGFTILCKLKI